MKLQKLQKLLEKRAARMCPIWKNPLCFLSELIQKYLDVSQNINQIVDTARKLGADDPVFAIMDAHLSKEYAEIQKRIEALATEMADTVPDEQTSDLLLAIAAEMM